MFSKLSLFAAIAAIAAIAAPLASALILEAPTNPSSGGTVTIMWTSEANDANTFDLYLVNTIFHNNFAISNNVDPAPQQITLTFPAVPPGDGYTIEATNTANITNVYAQTSTFSIGTTSSLSVSSTATSPLPSGLSSSSTLSQVNTLITTTSSSTPNTSPSSSPASPTQTVGSFSGASRRLDVTVGGMAAAIFTIGGVAILTL